MKERDREVITLHYFEEMSSPEIGEFLGVSENTIKSRLRRARQQLKKYEFMIQEALDRTTERRHHPYQDQMKGEINMADEAKIEARLKELQRQIANLQEEIKVVAAESDIFHADDMQFHDPQRSEALQTICYLPVDAERQISWGYLGAYGTPPNKTNKRIAFWSTDIDNFLSKAPNADLVNFASLFTNPTVVAVLRQLVEGKKSVADLAKGGSISEGETEKAVALLMDETLVERTADNFIKPKNDVISFFLNFVSMTIVHLGHIRPKN